MLSDDATPVIFFVASLYFFAIVLLYVLARAWEQALSTRSVGEKAPCPVRIASRGRPVAFHGGVERRNTGSGDGNEGN